MLVLDHFVPVVKRMTVTNLLTRGGFVPRDTNALGASATAFNIVAFTIVFVITTLSFFPMRTLDAVTRRFDLWMGDVGGGGSTSLFRGRRIVRDLGRSFIGLGPQAVVVGPVVFAIRVMAIVVLIIAVLSLGESRCNSFKCGLLMFIVLFTALLFTGFTRTVTRTQNGTRTSDLHGAHRRAPTGLVANSGLRAIDDSGLGGKSVFIYRTKSAVPTSNRVVRKLTSVSRDTVAKRSTPIVERTKKSGDSIANKAGMLSSGVGMLIARRPNRDFLSGVVTLMRNTDQGGAPGRVTLAVLLTNFALMFIVIYVALVPFTSCAGVSRPNAAVSVTTVLSLFIYLVPAAVKKLLSTVNVTNVSHTLHTGIVAGSNGTIRATKSVSALLLSGANAVAVNGHGTAGFRATPKMSRHDFMRTYLLTSLSSRAPRNGSVMRLKHRSKVQVQGLGAANTHVVGFATRAGYSNISLSSNARVHGKTFSTVHQVTRGTKGAFPGRIRRAVTTVSNGKNAPLIMYIGRRIAKIVRLRSVVGPNVRRHFRHLHGVKIGAIVIAKSGPLATGCVTRGTKMSSFVTRTGPRSGVRCVQERRRTNGLITVVNSKAGSTPTLTRTGINMTVGDNARTTGRTNGVMSLSGSPAGLVRVIRVNGRLLVAHNALAAFSVTGSMTGCFTVMPTLFVITVPRLTTLGVVNLRDPRDTVLSTMVFGTVVVPVLVPLTLGKMRCGPVNTDTLLHHGLLVCKLKKMVMPFVKVGLVSLMMDLFFWVV